MLERKDILGDIEVGTQASQPDAAYGNHSRVTSTVSDVVEKLVMNEGQ